MTTIPHWRQSTVAEEFDVQLGKRLDAAVNRGELKTCINNRGVRWGQVQPNEAIFAPLTVADIRDLRLDSGDVLMCEGGEIGRSAVWNDEVPEAYFLNTLHRLRSRGRYNPRLLVAFFERWANTGELSALAGKATLAHLTKENLLRVPLPAPSREEQDRIVDALNTVDELIATLERLTAKKHSIKNGMMQQLLTGRTRLPGFVAKWQKVKLRDAGTTYGGLVGKGKGDFGAGSASYISFVEVMANARLTGSRLERVRVRAGERQNRVLRDDVLFNGSSETPEEVALAAAVEFDPSSATYLNSFCFGYRIKDARLVNSLFLAYLFRSDEGRRLVLSLAQGATRYNIAKTKLMQLSPVLPQVEEQRAIVGVLRDAEAEIEAIECRLTKARYIKAGMMQQLLTGRVRLAMSAAS